MAAPFLRLALALSLTAGPVAAVACASASPSPSFTVIASGLNQPKKITIAPNGDLIVALSGDGRAPSSCKDGNQRSCVDASGAIDQITPGGHVSTLLPGLVSISQSAGSRQATGPVEARLIGGKLQVLVQGVTINQRTGRQIYGPAGVLLGDLVTFLQQGGSASNAGGFSTIQAALGPYEASHNPDHGAGTIVQRGLEHPIDSDPYAFVPYRGGYAVADAGGNDLLFISRTGRISLLAVFGTIAETAPPRTYGSSQTKPVAAQAQAVPTSVAVGPDGALYVGELGGVPYQPGTASVYRVVPGHKPTRYAGGFTTIADIAFDHRGRLLVLEVDRKGLNDPGLSTGKPAGGAIIRVARNGAKTIVAAKGLVFPTGLAVAPSGCVYVSNDGATPAGIGHGGEIVRLSLR